MTEQWTEVPADWSIKDIGAPLLGSLAEGLYDAPEVLREYVQNAVDAYVDFQRLTGRNPQNTVQIYIDSTNSEVHVMDAGVGMNRHDILQAKSIAVSHKLGRPNEFVGFRGIGIWSGLSACDALILQTTKVNDPYVYRLMIDFRSIIEHVYDPIPIDELLKGRFQIHHRPGNLEDHYTHVRLVNVDRDRYGKLLDVKEMTRYASLYLPVPFDPKWSYSHTVHEVLAAVPSTTTYELTINGDEVYRCFPTENQIKKPERHIIYDDQKKPVAVAWVAETNKKGQRKALEPDLDRGEATNFAIRIKNFAVGQRGLYATPEDVLDCDNLSWYVGEIYITDTDIKPDTNRGRFQQSYRSRDVIKAIRDFYTAVATGARGWSEEVSVNTACKEVEDEAVQIEHLLANGASGEEIGSHWSRLEEYRKKLEEAHGKANAVDGNDDSPRILAVRRYLRKQEVRDAIQHGLGRITALEQQIKAQVPEAMAAVIITTPAGNGRRKRSSARTANLKGKPITASDAVATGVVAGFQGGLWQTLTSGEETKQPIDINLAVNAFLAAAAAVLGEASDAYRQISERLPEELRRRGIDV